jgi:putative ABC transport system ATP-binding protein
MNGTLDHHARSYVHVMTHTDTVAAAPLIRIRNVSKQYPTAGGSFTALHDLTLSIDRGEFVAVIGESGSGKSTLLSLIAGIDRPSSGEVVVGGTAVHALSEAAMSAWRGTAVGIVFQFFQLLPTLSAAENVMLPMDFCDRWPARDRRDRALALLDSLGVADQQRVAIARALANDPPLLLADEPTGNLDSKTSESMLELFAGLVRDGRTLVLVTHAVTALRFASRAITIADGRIQQDAPALAHA